MYNIDTSSLGAYIGTMLALVSGGLKLDPLAFQAVFDYQGQPTWLLVWLVFVAGLSLMVGQSVVLFANRVRPARFVISLLLGASNFVINVVVIVLVIWAIANFIGARPWYLPQIGRAIALASAPYWLSFLVLIPYLGLIWERLLKVYVFLALLAAVQTIFDLTFFNALLGSLVALLLAQAISSVLGHVLTPLTTRLTYALVGPEELSSTRDIYEMFARRNQIG